MQNEDNNNNNPTERKAVVETNDDATASKYAAVLKHYWDDPLIHFFVPSGARIQRPPLINRGTFTRVAAIDSTVKHFLSCGGTQIVNLGAGYDTSFARLRCCCSFPAGRSYTWWDVDLPEVVSQKAAAIAEVPHVRGSFMGEAGTISLTGEGPERTLDIHTMAGAVNLRYVLQAADLRDTAAFEAAARKVLDPNVPTLFISEVVLVYMDPEDGDRLIEWVGRTFRAAEFVVFEQILPNDPFGKMMLKNISLRGCTLHSIEKYPTLAAQEKRYKDRGFSYVDSIDMNRVYTGLTAGDRALSNYISRLELFDELEEWLLLQAHYCLVTAVKDTDSIFWKQPSPRFVCTLPRNTSASSPFIDIC